MKLKLPGALCTLFLLAGLMLTIRAQALDNHGEAPEAAGAPQRSGNSSIPGGYRFPTAHERLHNYLSDTFGPMRLAFVAGSAGVLHWYDSPPEWHGDIGGYGRRLAYTMGLSTIKRTAQFGANEAFHLDGRYYRCDCKGFIPRLGHVLKSSFSARNREGRDVFSVSWLASNYAGEMIAVPAWYPDRYSYKDGIRQGHWAMLARVGMDAAREFIFRRK